MAASPREYFGIAALSPVFPASSPQRYLPYLRSSAVLFSGSVPYQIVFHDLHSPLECAGLREAAYRLPVLTGNIRDPMVLRMEQYISLALSNQAEIGQEVTHQLSDRPPTPPCVRFRTRRFNRMSADARTGREGLQARPVRAFVWKSFLDTGNCSGFPICLSRSRRCICPVQRDARFKVRQRNVRSNVPLLCNSRFRFFCHFKVQSASAASCRVNSFLL